jgi:hypothetical protein
MDKVNIFQKSNSLPNQEDRGQVWYISDGSDFDKLRAGNLRIASRSHGLEDITLAKRSHELRGMYRRASTHPGTDCSSDADAAFKLLWLGPPGQYEAPFNSERRYLRLVTLLSFDVSVCQPGGSPRSETARTCALSAFRTGDLTEGSSRLRQISGALDSRSSCIMALGCSNSCHKRPVAPRTVRLVRDTMTMVIPTAKASNRGNGGG